MWPCAFQEQRPWSCPEDFIAATLFEGLLCTKLDSKVYKVRWKLQSTTPVTETVVGHGSHVHAVFMAMSQKTQIKESTTKGRCVKTWHPSCEADEPTLDVEGAPTIWSQPGLRYAGAGNTGEVEFSNKWTIQIYPDLRWWSNECNIGPTNFNTLPPPLIVDILAAQTPAVVSHWPHVWWNRLGVKSTNHQSLNHPKIMTRRDTPVETCSLLSLLYSNQVCNQLAYGIGSWLLKIAESTDLSGHQSTTFCHDIICYCHTNTFKR